MNFQSGSREGVDCVSFWHALQHVATIQSQASRECITAGTCWNWGPVYHFGRRWSVWVQLPVSATLTGLGDSLTTGSSKRVHPETGKTRPRPDILFSLHLRRDNAWGKNPLSFRCGDPSTCITWGLVTLEDMTSFFSSHTPLPRGTLQQMNAPNCLQPCKAFSPCAQA